MSEIKKNVKELFKTSSQLLSGTQLFAFKEALELIELRLEQPMQVAVIGEICSSKSTLVNAMLGEEEIVRTGIKEETFNVSWLKYGDTDANIIVHFKEPKGKIKEVQRSKWENYANRLGQQTMQENVSYISVSHDNEALNTFNIIDTPGLNAHYGIDSKNTLEFLHKVRPDAIILLFTKSITQRMVDILRDFQGVVYEQMTPVNTIGILAKIDAYWPNEVQPILAGNNIAKRLFTQEAAVKNTMYQLYPICARLALGARTIDKRDFKLLQTLCLLEDNVFERLVSTVKRFEKDNDELPITVDDRKYLNQKFTRYGIAIAVDSLKKDKYLSIEVLRKYLLEKSGFSTFYESLIKHFGHRSYVIKLSGVFSDVCKLVEHTLEKTEGCEKYIVQKIGSLFTTLALNQQELQELDILRCFYEGELDLSEEEEKELMNITGENGMSYAARLGMASTVTIEEMKSVAKKRCQNWHIKSVTTLVDLNLKRASKVLENSYKHICSDIEEAQIVMDGTCMQLWGKGYKE